MPVISIARIPFILDGYLSSLPLGLPIAWEGEPFEPPTTMWLRPVCRTGNNEDTEKGQEGWSRRVGLYLIDICQPSPGGTKDAWSTAAKLEKACRRRCVEGVYLEDPKTDNLGIDQFDTFRLRVTVPWWCWTA